MSAAKVNQLLSTVVSLDDTPHRRRVGLLIIVIALYLVGWIVFLSALTITRLHQQAFHYFGTTSVVSWFDPLDGFYICLVFLIPAGVIAVITLFDWLKIRYYPQAYAFAGILLHKKGDLLIPISSQWSSSSLEIPPKKIKIRGIHPLGWYTAGRRYRVWHMLLSGAMFTTLSATTLVNLTHFNVVGEQPIDVLTPLVAFFVIVSLFIPSGRLLASNWSTAHFNELGLMLPPGNLPQPARLILWHEITALYYIEMGAKYWLLFTHEHIYGWLVSSSDFQQRGTQLAQTIVAHAKVPVYDATSLCKVALSSNTPKIPATAEFAMLNQWQHALAQAEQLDPRQRPNIAPAITLVIVGLVLGVAATFIINQIAINWAIHL